MTARLPEAGAQYVLEVTLAGRVHRFAEVAVEIDGYPYTGGLEVGDVSTGDQMFDVDSEPPSVTVDGLVFDVDLAALEGGGTWLESGTAELARIAGGARQTIVRGAVANPAYGLEGEPASLAILPTGRDERTVWPPDGALVDATTWPSAPEGSEGARYPWVIGKPGLPAAYPDTRRGATPAIVLDVSASETTLLVSGGRVAAGSVRVIRTDVPGSEACPVTQATDGSGRTVSVATWPYGSGDTGDDEVLDTATFRVDWSTSLGGIVGHDGEALGPMGRLTEYMLSQSTVEWDRGAWASVRTALDAYRVDGYLDEPAPPWQTCRQAWLWLAPLRIEPGPRGLWPIVWNIEDPTPRIELSVGVDCERVGDLLTNGAQKANAFAFAIAPDASGELTRTIRLDKATAHPCAVSEQHFNRIDSAEELDGRMVYDAPTAARSLTWRAIAYAFPWRVRSILATTSRARALLKGDVVTLTDADSGVNAQPAYIVDAERGIDSVTLTLVIIHRP